MSLHILLLKPRNSLEIMSADFAFIVIKINKIKNNKKWQKFSSANSCDETFERSRTSKPFLRTTTHAMEINASF